MGLMLLFTPLILQTSAFKHPNYHDFTYELRSNSPIFYTNLDQFDTIKPVSPKFNDTGRLITHLKAANIDQLYKILPNYKNELDEYVKLIKELYDLNIERQLISKKILSLTENRNIDNDNNEVDDKYKDLTESELRELAINVRNKIIIKEKERFNLHNKLKIPFNSIPLKKLANVPKDKPLIMNINKRPTFEKHNNENNILNLQLNDSSITEKNLLTHDEIIKRFNYPWQKSSRMLRTLSGGLTILENALINFLIWTSVNLFGFIPVSVPYLTDRRTLESTGHLPKFQDNLFSVNYEDENLYLIPTGEVPLVGMLSNYEISPDKLPLKLVTYTQCFRNEKVGYGTESKGLIRQHQFGKVELLVVTDENNSSNWHSLLVSQVEFLLRALSLGYMTELLPIHDTPFTSAITVDVKGFFPAKNEYIELSSISNTLDYQAKALKIHIKDSKNRCHILNASGLPIGRLLACILETHQVNINGNLMIKIPKLLRNFSKCGKFISPFNNSYFNH